MIKKWISPARLDKVETAYLLALRVAGLAAATLCLIAAVIFVLDAAWRLFVPTKVAVEEVVVTSADVARAMQSPPPRNEDGESEPIPEYIKDTHKTFSQTVWPKYYAIYKSAFDAYHKEEDKIVPSNDLMDNLGYGLSSYAAEAASSDLRTNPITAFVSDDTYQAMALATVSEAMKDPRTVKLLGDYKKAEKSETRCVTTPTRQYVPQTCGFYYIYDCSYTRTVQVERCEKVYPDGIVSPVQAFERADIAFATAFIIDRERKVDKAATERSRREATRAKIGPRLRLAITILCAFLGVMFIFLIVAIERHLRRMAKGEVAAT